MELTQYIVDAFTNKVFSGNPAAVCLLKSWLPDESLKKIASENNLSETAFIIGGSGHYKIRWLTPTREVDLCGHATLASAFIIMNFIEPDLQEVTFESKSGNLCVKREGELFSLDFPSRPGTLVEYPESLAKGLGIIPKVVLLSRDYLVIVDSEEEVANCSPQFSLLQDLPSYGIIVTAPGNSCDFVSRVFFPMDSMLEDPVTGSAHCTLIPYWANRLGKKQLHAKQISSRVGELFCLDHGDRVHISGHAVLYGKGSIFLP